MIDETNAKVGTPDHLFIKSCLCASLSSHGWSFCTLFPSQFMFHHSWLWLVFAFHNSGLYRLAIHVKLLQPITMAAQIILSLISIAA